MKVVEIFKSIDGEGIRAGLPVTFVRLYGCNLNCSYCDTPYSHITESDKAFDMSVDEIVRAVEHNGIPNVTITGGEPMIHSDIIELFDELLERGYYVNVETNGTYPVPTKYNVGYANAHKIIFTMDYKCPSSGMREEMSIANLNTLRCNDVLKFVVGSKEDMDDAQRVLSLIKSDPFVFFSPVFGKIEPESIVKYMLYHHLYNCRVQIQMHKVIWNPNERGV